MGKDGCDIHVQQEKAITKVNSISCDLKKGKKMEASVIYTPLHDN